MKTPTLPDAIGAALTLAGVAGVAALALPALLLAAPGVLLPP